MDNVVEVLVRADIEQLVAQMNQGATVVGTSTTSMTGSFNKLAYSVKQDVAQVNAATASLKTETAKLPAAFLEAGAAAEGAMEVTKHEIYEARHAAHLLAEEMGVKLPRALQGVIANSATFGRIFSQAFNVIAAIGFYEVIKQVAEKFSEIIADMFIFNEQEKKALELAREENKEITELAKHRKEQADKEHQLGRDAVSLLTEEKTLTEQKLAAEQEHLKTLLEEQRVKLKIAQETNDNDPRNANLPDDAKIHGPTPEARKAKDELKKIGDEIMIVNVKANDLQTTLGRVNKELGIEAKKAAEDGAIKSAKDVLEGWEMTFMKLRQSEGEFHDVSKADELKFWEEKLKVAETKYPAVYKQILAKVIELEKQNGAETLETQKAKIDTELAAEETGSMKRIAIIDKWLDYLKIHGYKEDTREYQAALAEKEVATRQWSDKQKRDAEKALSEKIKAGVEEVAAAETVAEERLGIARDELDHEVALGRIDVQRKVQLEQQLENQLHAIKLKALQDKLAILKRDPDKNLVEITKANKQIEVEAMRHERELNKIVQQGTHYRDDLHKALHSSMQSSLSGAVKGMLFSQQSLAESAQQVAASILGSFVDLGVQMLTDWIEKHILMRVFGQTSNVGMIASDAALGAAAAYASTAAIPIIGPVLAPAAAAQAYGTIMSFTGLAAFEKGGNVPADMPAFLHKNEMVLPAHIAGAVRDAAEGGSMGKNGITVNAPINAMDSKSFEQQIDRHATMLARKIHQKMKKMGYVQ